jgi:hypothetical protein
MYTLTRSLIAAFVAALPFVPELVIFALVCLFLIIITTPAPEEP